MSEPKIVQDYLWHYRSWGGLKGILTSNTLWGSNAAYLKDTEEVETRVRLNFAFH